MLDLPKGTLRDQRVGGASKMEEQRPEAEGLVELYATAVWDNPYHTFMSERAWLDTSAL